MTENHGYHTPERGAPNWDEPLNENFDRLDTDVEIRDTSDQRDEYEPAEGAMFVELDTGIAYLGDGTSWSPALAMGHYDEEGNLDHGELGASGDGESGGNGAGGYTVGKGAHSVHPGAIVIGDSTGSRMYSEAPDEVRSQMPIYAPSFNTTSTSAAKTGIEPVDPETMLQGVESLAVSEWEFIETDDGRHVGPMAEEFQAAFGLGASDESIASVDADGVALAAIQGLARRQREETAALRSLLEEKDEQIERLESVVDDLSERVGDLVADD